MSVYISGIGMPAVINRLGNDLVGVEIGVCSGVNLKYLLETCINIKKLIGVDPWVEYSEMPQLKIDIVYAESLINLEPLMKIGRAEIIRKTSVQASQDFADSSIDFVYIDGEHTYKAVTEDLNSWFPKVKVNGLISGHDWGYPAVTSAIMDFLARMNKSLAKPHLLENNSWYFIKE